jgi:hypothetical protein
MIRIYAALCAGILIGMLASVALADSAVARNSSAPNRLPMVSAMLDVALGAGNTLKGQVVDREAVAQANCEVWITREGGGTLKVRTDASGRFSASELPPGICRIETAAGGGRFRLWPPKTAPADAQSNVLLVVAKSGGNTND